MLIRHSSELPQNTLPNPSLSGWELIKPTDGVHFSCYEAIIPSNSTVLLQAPPGCPSNHIYYCIDGEGIYQLTDGIGENHSIKHGYVIALSSHLTGNLTTSTGGMRLFVIYCNDDNADAPRHIVRSVEDIDGTDRDIDFGKGHSRRFILKRDGFPVSVHLTTLDPGNSMKLEYKNHLEGVYFYAGTTKYIWNGRKDAATTKVANGNGTLVCMDKNDPHTIDTTVGDQEAKCVCVFYPALVGMENHNLSAEGYSGYELV